MRTRWLSLLFLASSCAHVAPTRELRIYDVPLHDALNMAQLLVLQREGVHLHRTNQESIFVSPAVDKLRWVVAGRALGPRRCSVGIYRVQLFSQGDTVMTHNADEQKGAEASAAPTLDDTTWVPDPGSLDVFRAFELEPALAERLDALAAQDRPARPAAAPQGPGATVEVHSAAPVPDAGALDVPAPEVPAPDSLVELVDEPEPEPATPGPAPRIVDSRSDCGLAAQDIDAFFEPGNLLLVGDRLGTREIPEAFGALVCWALEKHLPTLVGIDMPREEQHRLDAFMRSDGSNAAREALLAGAFWHWPYPDGSSSLALVDMLDRLRGWRRAGAGIRVFAFGPGALAGNPREATIATELAALRRENPRAFTLVLSGNAHVTRKAGTRWDPELLPFGYRLGSVDALHVMALDVTFKRGEGWNCKLLENAQLKCGVTRLLPPLSPLSDDFHVKGLRRAIRYQATNDTGFDGLLDLGHLNASPPAVDPGAVVPKEQMPD